MLEMIYCLSSLLVKSHNSPFNDRIHTLACWALLPPEHALVAPLVSARVHQPPLPALVEREEAAGANVLVLVQAGGVVEGLLLLLLLLLRVRRLAGVVGHEAADGAEVWMKEIKKRNIIFSLLGKTTF